MKSTTNKTSRFAMRVLSVILIMTVLNSCDQSYTPKPKGYFRISFPEKKYVHYVPEDCPFDFDIPVYSVIVRDTSPQAEPCWMNLEFPQNKGTIYLSYKLVNNNLDAYIEDSRNLSMKHIPRASGIEELPIVIPDKKVYGTYYSVKGGAASPIQFYITDSTKHFLRGSLYFFATPQPDSIAPVVDFISKDIDHLIQTFNWK